MPDLAELERRLAEATGPDRELDLDLARAHLEAREIGMPAEKPDDRVHIAYELRKLCDGILDSRTGALRKAVPA